MQVNMLEGKNRLSKLVKAAQAGEEVIIANHGVLAWAEQGHSLHASAVGLEEIAYGLAWRPNPRIQAWLDGFFSRPPAHHSKDRPTRRCAAWSARGPGQPKTPGRQADRRHRPAPWPHRSDPQQP